MISDLVETADWLRIGLSGWQFVFSADFRRDRLQLWRGKKRLWVVWQIVCGLAGIAFSLLLVFAVGYLVFVVAN